MRASRGWGSFRRLYSSTGEEYGEQAGRGQGRHISLLLWKEEASPGPLCAVSVHQTNEEEEGLGLESALTLHCVFATLHCGTLGK